MNRCGWVTLFLILILLTGFYRLWADVEILVDDRLANGQTTGIQHGGTFTSEGWKTTDWRDHISYDLGAAVSAGRISFDIKGLTMGPEIWNWEQEHMWHTVLGMWDGDFERYGIQAKFNPFKCQLWLARNENDPYKSGHVTLRVNVNAPTGYDDDPNAFEVVSKRKWNWEPNVTYHFVLEWGHGEMRWTIADSEAIYIDYSSTGEDYAPPHHVLRLGFGDDHVPDYYWMVTPRYLTYSNFKVEAFRDFEPPTVLQFEPGNNSQNVDIDSEIRINFSEPMNKNSVAAGFSVQPAVAGSLVWSGISAYFVPESFFQENTEYRVTLTTNVSDLNGNALAAPLNFSFRTGSANSQSTIGLYDVFELRLQGSETKNAYLDTWVKGRFTGPGKTIEIDGFWDGGNVWKVRMAPTAVGLWNYSITSSDPKISRSGSFECVASANKGFLKKNPERPYTFMYEDGTPFLWKGETSWRAFTNSVPFESRFIPYIDKRVAEGYNAVQAILVSYINGLGFWKNEGGLIFDESSGAKDYDLLNPDYFHWIDKRIEYMVSKDVVPVIFFTWAQELVKFSEDQFKRFERYVISRYAAYNVVWVISGEYDEVYTDNGWSQADIERYGTYAYSIDPYKHPITLHPTGRSSSREFGYQDWLGCVMQQGPYWHDEILKDRIFSKPVINGEYAYSGWHADDDARIGAWEIITAGGFFTAGFYTTFAPDKGGWDLSGNQLQADQLSALFQFMDSVEWWRMEPHDDLVSAGYCLAQPGKEYVIYLRNGGSVALNLKDVGGTLPVEWLNPRDGTYQRTADVTGGGTVNLAAPFSGDAVVHVGQWLAKDVLAPNPPRNLLSTQVTEHSITLAWQAPDVASDGDRANQYQIYRNGQLITAVTMTTFIDTNLKENTEYAYEVFSIDDRQNKSASAATGRYTTLADRVSPQLVRAWLNSATELKVRFSEPVEAQSATQVGNYRIEPAISINRIELAPDQQNITLTTGVHLTGQKYSLMVNNVKDQAKNANTIARDSGIYYTFAAELQISNLKPSHYRVEKLASGDRYYVDRDYVLKDVPARLQNAWWIMTGNDDKETTGENFISFQVNQVVEVLVGFDASIASIPTWLQIWESTGERISTSDDSDFMIYRKVVNAGTVTLGANNGNGTASMYTVLIQAAQQTDIAPPAAPTGISLRAK